MDSMQEAPVGFSVTELANGDWDPRIRVFRVVDEVDVAVIVAATAVMLVDTTPSPTCAAQVLHHLESALHARQLLVVNTHADYDHAWGNALFRMPDGVWPAPIVASTLAGERLRSRAEQQYLVGRQAQDPRFAAVELVPPTVELAAGGTLHGGDLAVQLLPTPGHTPDHLSLWVPAAGVLLAGDATEHPFPCCGKTADLDQLVASLRRLMALKPRTVIPCHGGPADAGLLAQNVRYVVDLDARVRRALAAGINPADLAVSSDPGRDVGLPYEQAVREQGADPSTTPACYREWHRQALWATVARVVAGGPPLSLD